MAELIEMPRQGVLRFEQVDLADDAGAPGTVGDLPDAAERTRALEESRSWIVEAPAGSGKTGLLLQRYLRLLGSARVNDPEEVLAITFTRAATEEIRARVLGELEKAAQGTAVSGGFEQQTRVLAVAALARDRERGWGLLESPDRLRVRSIDSVAGEIARLLPVTSGGGGAAPVEEPSPLYREAARRTLRLLGGEDAELSQALRTVLLHRDGDLSFCEALIAEMLATREQWGKLVPAQAEELSDEALDRNVRPQLDRALEYAICSTLTRAAQILPAGFLDRLSQAAAEMAERSGYESQTSPILSCSGRNSAPEAIAEHLEQWRALAHLLITPSAKSWRKGFAANHLGFAIEPKDRVSLRALVDEVRSHDDALAILSEVTSLPPARYPERQWGVAKALFRVLHRAQTELKVVFAETGECDFAEPALLAVAALRQRHGARAYEAALGIELRHLLVDEMQDTSTGQYELLELLTVGWAAEGRTVFLVGDPKQSIYLFRQARVERFVHTLREQRLGGLPVGALRLSANFRSQAGLVRGLNESFARIFPRERAHVDDIVYAPAEAMRAAADECGVDGGQQWHAAVARGTDEERKQIRRRAIRANANRVREIIATWRRRPLPADRKEPWRIAVLVASRRELKPIVAALKRNAGEGPIPFRAVNVEPLREQPEILDLLALTRALQHPADRVAWWALLRAPWCGLGLAALHRLAGEDDPALMQRTVLELIRERGDLLEPESLTRLEHVWSVLSQAIAQTGRLPLPELIERTWGALRGDTYLGTEALANTRQFFALIEQQYRDTADLSIALLERRLDRLFAAASQVEDAVDLMTIHGAKGLEWDVVLVPELERRAPFSRTRLLEWEELTSDDEASAQVVLAPIAAKGEDSGALHAWLRGIRSRRLAAERRRQFYVACTRAREELHLFGTATEHKSEGIKPEPASLLEAAWPAAAEAFVAGPHVLAARPEPPAAPIEKEVADAPAGLSLAAGAEEAATPAVLERLPLHVLRDDATLRLTAALATGAKATRTVFARPEGSFAARSLGNAVHAFLELAATRLSAGAGAAELDRELPAWRSRVHAVLRADGLAPGQTKRLAEMVERAIHNTLGSEAGQWLLANRADARSEYALTLRDMAPARVRLDRIFRAGAKPLAPGEDHLWIVDYKTGSHAPAGLDAWLEAERVRYAGQMQTYARAFPGEQVRVALWYPMVARLVWWQP